MKQLTIVFHLHHHEFHLVIHMGLWCSHHFTSIIDIYYYFSGLLLLPLHILISPIFELLNIEFGINCCLVLCLRNLTMLDLDHGHCHLDQSFFKVHQSLAFQISFLGWAPPWTGAVAETNPPLNTSQSSPLSLPFHSLLQPICHYPFCSYCPKKTPL